MRDNGIILIDKPAGLSSFGVVARLKRVLTENYGKKVKVGHTGTLDPFATGLMIIVVGRACQQAGDYSKLDKIYQATIRLGQRSSTGDPEGEKQEISDRQPSQDEIERVLGKFIGQITQTPPIYSAIKINGQRAYKLARKGEKVDMPSRQVTIYNISLDSYIYPELMITAKVSSGTYIRTLAEDIGKALGVGAYCFGLRRLAIAEHKIESAQQLSDFGIID